MQYILVPCNNDTSCSALQAGLFISHLVFYRFSADIWAYNLSRMQVSSNDKVRQESWSHAEMGHKIETALTCSSVVLCAMCSKTDSAMLICLKATLVNCLQPSRTVLMPRLSTTASCNEKLVCWYNMSQSCLCILESSQSLSKACYKLMLTVAAFERTFWHADLVGLSNNWNMTVNWKSMTMV